MKPDWDKLMAEFKDSKTALVADVDCTAGGKSLCDSVGVRGFPTIKYGDPNSLEDYSGGRSFNDFSSFAKENLKPVCSPAKLDLCDDEKKATIEKFMAMSSDELDALLTAEEKKIADAESLFETEVSKLQKKYESLMAEKDATQAEVTSSGLGLMKSVKAFKVKSGDKKD